MLLSTAFLAGLMGSFHCVGMCGPIALALPGRRWAHRLLYQAGRVATYALLGAVVGSMGRGVALLGGGRYVALVAGAALLLSALRTPGGRVGRLVSLRGLYRLAGRLQGYVRRWPQRHAPLAAWLLGMTNGLIPCGLVYVALSGAVVSGRAAGGAAYMVLFGLGTLPLMLLAQFADRLIPLPWRAGIRRLVPLFVAALGLLFLLRGLELGIPYVSPALPAGPDGAATCR